MRLTTSEAIELLQALEAASKVCLDALGIPHRPKGKTVAWKVSGGPIGMGHHFTNGVSGIKSLRWFNDPAWGNTGSSCHVMIFDRLIDELADIWPRQEAASVFKVPVILHADVTRGTWNINWANTRLFGVENRNAGYCGYRKLPGGLTDLGKVGVTWQDRVYEEYWREQIAANILLGRIWRAIRGQRFKPEWICGHSQIKATKADPGPLFPSMHEMREAIWSDQAIEELPLLLRYDPAVEGPELDADSAEELDQDRGEPTELEKHWHVEDIGTLVPEPDDQVFTSEALYLLGWPTGSKMLSAEELKPFVAYFQRSTVYYRKAGQPERVLKVDGWCGPKTIKELERRLTDLRLK